MLFLDGRRLDSGLDYTPGEQPVGVSVWKAFAIDNHASLMYKRTSVGACRMLIKSVDRMIAVLRNLCLLSMAAMILSGVLCAQVDQGAIRGTVQDPTGAVVPSAKVTLTNEDTRFTLETTTSGGGRVRDKGVAWSDKRYMLGGIDKNNDTVDFNSGTAFVILTPPDAIQEVSVQTSNFTAEYGRAGSAVVNATTKSGTNQLRGNLWEYLRNDKLDASTWSANRAGTAKPELRQNQFGFTIGGPVYLPHVYNGHNKTFFFGDYQGTQIARTSLRNPTVPTRQERNSGFTDFQELIFSQSGTRTDNLGRIFPNGSILDPATTRAITHRQMDPVTGLISPRSEFVRDPFFQGDIAGITNFTSAATESLMNLLPASRLDPNAIKLLNTYPAPNTAGFVSGTSADYAALRPQPDQTNQFDTRIDQNFSEKDQMFGRVGYAARSRTSPG